MANIKTIKEAIDICRKANITLFIWGHRGIGKSSLVKQYAMTNQMGLIDLRCSQIEASDLRGLPESIGGKTHYLPPSDMPSADLTLDEINQCITECVEGSDASLDLIKRMQPRYPKGILFLDEVNRAQDDVLQAVFELIYDRSIGEYSLPQGWSIVAAGNFIDGYITNNFTDAAFLDRFCHITLSSGESTFQEWIDYMSLNYAEAASEIIEFTSHNIEHLDGTIDGELGFSIQPSRRSWEMVTKIKSIVDKSEYSKQAVLECYSGLIGRDLAISFMKYSCPVKPIDLIKNGVVKYEKELEKLQRNQLCGLMWGLVSYSKNRIESDTIANTCLDFAKYMVKSNKENDLVVAFCRALIPQEEEIKCAAISNPKLAKLVSKYGQKQDNKKDFISRLSEIPELQEPLSRIAWGS